MLLLIKLDWSKSFFLVILEFIRNCAKFQVLHDGACLEQKKMNFWTCYVATGWPVGLIRSKITHIKWFITNSDNNMQFSNRNYDEGNPAEAIGGIQEWSRGWIPKETLARIPKRTSAAISEGTPEELIKQILAGFPWKLSEGTFRRNHMCLELFWELKQKNTSHSKR